MKVLQAVGETTGAATPAARDGIGWPRAGRAWALGAAIVVLWYVVAQFVGWRFLDAAPRPDAWLRDLAAHLLVGAVLLAVARDVTRFALAAVALFSALTLANGLKLGILGGPIAPDDFGAAVNLFWLFDGWALWGSVALVGVPLVLLVRMFDWRAKRAWVVLGALSGGVAFAAAFPEAPLARLDARIGDSVWDNRGNFESRGLPLHLVQEGLRNLARRPPPPDFADVAEALQRIGGSPIDGFVKTSDSGASKRNVHVVVLESFWDPAGLVEAGLSADPLDPAFRTLWAEAGRSRALSPVFGGYTANAEFEILCGFPVRDDAVFFEGRLRRDVPCLPRHLEQAGYASFASHPNVAPFWNRVNAYRRVGFSTYWSARDFALDDMNGEFLSDESLFRQVLARLEPVLAGPVPIFNYVLTYFGHLHYPLNERRPDVIVAASGDSTVTAYANTVYYKSREVMVFVRELRIVDPDAVVVLVGDHLPNLGLNFSAYAESGLLKSDRGEFDDEMFRTLVATPLIVIDGARGPVPVGDLPMYALPALILDLLGDPRESVLRLAAGGLAGDPVRPLPGMHFMLHEGRVVACRGVDDDERCGDASRWIDAVAVVGRDLFAGRQHVLGPVLPLPGRLQAAASLPGADGFERRVPN